MDSHTTRNLLQRLLMGLFATLALTVLSPTRASANDSTLTAPTIGEVSTEQGLSIEGNAEPDSSVELWLDDGSTEPVFVTTRADANGLWRVNLSTREADRLSRCEVTVSAAAPLADGRALFSDDFSFVNDLPPIASGGSGGGSMSFAVLVLSMLLMLRHSATRACWSRPKKLPLQLIAVVLLIPGTFNTLRADTMIGAYLPGDGWSRNRIVDFNNQVTRPLSYINLFSGFSHSWNHLWHQCSNVFSTGAIPLISWMPIDSSRRRTNILPEIIAGDWDNYIDTWAARLVRWVESYPADKRPTVMIRFGHEFNGNWYSYGDDPDNFVAAWQHVHQRLADTGAGDYAEWVWSANYVNVDSYDDMTRYYPGFEYVDWTSLDGYNWGSNYSWTRWKSFAETFASAYETLIRNYPDKPILIAEVASTEPADTPNPGAGQFGDNTDAGESKALWVEQMWQALQHDFPAIRAVTIFNYNKELGWSMSEPQSTGLNAFNLGLAGEHASADFLTTIHPVGIGQCSASPEQDQPANDASSPRNLTISSLGQRKLSRSAARPLVDTSIAASERDALLVLPPQQLARLQAAKHENLDRLPPFDPSAEVLYELHDVAQWPIADNAEPTAAGVQDLFRVPDSAGDIDHTARLRSNTVFRNPGRYTFSLRFAGAADLHVNGIKVLEKSEGAGNSQKTIQINRGVHDIELTYQKFNNENNMSVYWSLETDPQALSSNIHWLSAQADGLLGTDQEFDSALPASGVSYSGAGTISTTAFNNTATIAVNDFVFESSANDAVAILGIDASLNLDFGIPATELGNRRPDFQYHYVVGVTALNGSLPTIISSEQELTLAGATTTTPLSASDGSSIIPGSETTTIAASANTQPDDIHFFVLNDNVSAISLNLATEGNPGEPRFIVGIARRPAFND